MKTSSHFWLLLKNELSVKSVPAAGLLLGYWIFGTAFPLLLVFSENVAHGNLAMLFEAGFIPIFTFLCVCGLSIWTTFATIPAFSEIGTVAPAGGEEAKVIRPLAAFEFFVTRAVDRRIFFRARITAFFIIALLPLMLTVPVSFFAPESTIAFSNASSVTAHQRQEQYRQAFSVSHPAKFHEVAVPGQTVIPGGAVAFAAWLVWGAALGFVLLQGYSMLIARLVKSDNWWTILYPTVPPFIFLAAWIASARHWIQVPDNICENSFLLLATHPLAMVLALAALAVIVQIWCERRFSKLEIL